MSDIKLIEYIKSFWKRSTGEIITYTEGSLMDIIQLARKDILSLITTIESQKQTIINQTIERDQLAVATLQEFIKKNEIIESANIRLREFDVARSIWTIKLQEAEQLVESQKEEIESLKAITELKNAEIERLVKFLMDFRNRTPYAMYIEMIDGVLMTNIPQTQKGESNAQT